MPWRSPAIDELDALSRELARLARTLEAADDGIVDALWESELSLRHVSRRTSARADDLRRVIARRKRSA